MNQTGYEWVSKQQKYVPRIFNSEITFILREWNSEDGIPDAKEGTPTYVSVELGSDEPVAYFYTNLDENKVSASLFGHYQMTFFADTNDLVVNFFVQLLSKQKIERKKTTPFMSIGACSKI